MKNIQPWSQKHQFLTFLNIAEKVPLYGIYYGLITNFESKLLLSLTYGRYGNWFQFCSDTEASFTA